MRSCETKKANSDSNLASVSHISHFSHQKTDNFASSHADEFFAGAERKAAEANRQAMPVVAGMADQFRKVFGADQMKVVYAEENDRKLGTPPPAGIKPVLTGDKVPMPPKDQQEEVLNGVDCRTCLRYGPRDRYCGHKLRFMHEGEGIICAGRGYSPKGEPWKELLTEQQP